MKPVTNLPQVSHDGKSCSVRTFSRQIKIRRTAGTIQRIHGVGRHSLQGQAAHQRSDHMILTTTAGDNTPQPTTSTHDNGAVATAVTTAGHPQLVSDCTPPPVLIGLVHVQQMRERKRQIEALAKWSQTRETATAAEGGR